MCLPAAERNGLIKTIDRWMLAAAMEFGAKYKVGKAFVKLSRQTLSDPALVKWLAAELPKHGLKPDQLCVQFPEQEAARHLKSIKPVVDAFHKTGVNFALEHYGVDKNRMQILDLLKPSFIKIDGELMHTLTKDTALQKKVAELTAAASERDIETIAERVENANEMAVLFQLGVNFMQGHYVHEPEVVLEDADTPLALALEPEPAASAG